MTPLLHSLACALRQDIQSEVLITQKLLPRAQKTVKRLPVGTQIHPKVTFTIREATSSCVLGTIRAEAVTRQSELSGDSFYAQGNRNRSCNIDSQ